MDGLPAELASELLDSGQMRFTVAHPPLVGTTPLMLAWWFDHLDGEVEIEGTRLERFVAWHPADHTGFSYLSPGTDGRNAGPGARIRFRERFCGNARYAVDWLVVVEQHDEDAFVFAEWIAGYKVSRTEIRYALVQEATAMQQPITQCIGTLTVGVSSLSAVAGTFNRLFLPFLFREEVGMAWMRHHELEMQFLADFLPELYQLEAVDVG